MITYKDILNQAKNCLQNNKIPMTIRGIDKTDSTSLTCLAMLYLMEKHNEKI